jgi:hypothetical protein
MKVKVNDSVVPPREVVTSSRIDAGHVHLTLQDVQQERIGVTLIMSYKEAYELAVTTMGLVGGFYGVKHESD